MIYPIPSRLSRLETCVPLLPEQALLCTGSLPDSYVSEMENGLSRRANDVPGRVKQAIMDLI